MHQLKGLVGALGGLGDVRGAQQEGDAFVFTQRPVGPFSGRSGSARGRARARGSPHGGFPVGGDTRGLALLVFQPGGGLAVQVPGDHLGQALQHGVVDQVVRKGVAAQRVLRWSSGPGVGQVQRIALQKRLRQRDGEVHTGHGSHTRQLQCG